MPEPARQEHPITPVLTLFVRMAIRIGYLVGFMEAVAHGAIFAAGILAGTILIMAINDARKDKL